jgi:hypothetical protein
MFINSENWEDGRKYYKNTFVKLHSTKTDLGEKIWKITNIDKKYLDAVDVNGNEVRAELSRGINLNYILPRKTVYQYGENAAMLSRTPARQWFKGIHPENTSILVLDALGKWNPIGFDVATIEGYYVFEDAMNNFKGALHSAALSPRVAVCKAGGVFIDTVLVGKITSKTLNIKKSFVSFVKPLISMGIKEL